MRYSYTIFLLSLVMLASQAWGQCPPAGFPDSGNTCPEAPLLCPTLDGYCNTINNNNVPQSYPCCAGWTLNNDEWFSFFAGSTTITIELTPSNCTPGTGGQLGLQAAIYAACPGGGTAWCNNNLMDAQCSCTQNPFELSSTNFVVGQQYWFVIDGCAGSVCNYSIAVLEGSTAGFAPDPPGPISGPVTRCQGAGSSTYTVPAAFAATQYIWSISPSSAGTITQNGTTMTVNWAAGFSGTATICVITANSCYQNPNPSCIEVVVAPPPTATISGNGVICANTGGTVDLSISFTGEPEWRFTYAINGVPQTPITTSSNPYILTVNQAGTYSLVSVISNGCTGTATGSVNIQSVTINPSATTVSAVCGQSNGSVDLSHTGGNPTFVYAWSNGSTTQDLSGVPPGAYSVTITDGNGCTATIDVTVADNITTPNLSAAIVNNTTCNGGNGSIDLSVSPAGSYGYTWSNGATTQDISNLTPGTYDVTVTQGVTCSAVASYTVADNPNLPNVSAVPTNTTCDLANGSVNATASGGVSPYIFVWSNGETTEDLSNVVAGNYCVTITGGNGCTNTTCVNVSNSNPPINLSGTTVANTTCNGGNGSIDLTVNPAGTYTYNWSNNATTQDISNLPPGGYSVTVTSAGTCTAEISFNIPDNPNLPNPTATATQTSCDFANGSVNASVSGGVGPYTYSWSNGATTEDLSNVPAGNYCLTATGSNGCTSTVCVDVTNSNPPINISATVVNNTICNGGNGSIDVSVSPINPPTYTYTWSNGATTQDISNLLPGSYTIVVSAGGTCTAEQTFNVPDVPNLPSPTATPTQTSCDFSNGSINASVSGGVTPYTFTWSNGATTEDLSNIPAGNYCLTVTGGNGCTNTVCVDVANVNPPINLSATAMPNTVCNATPNGSINLTVNPINPPTYTFTWSNGAMTEDLSNVGPGSYTVTVSAGGTCTQVATFDVPANPNEPSVSTSVVGTTCSFSNGSVSISVTGGTTPYTYAWSNGSTSQNLSNIPAGDYSVTVTSPNGCTGLASLNVPNVNPPIDVNPAVGPNTTCNTAYNGNITLFVSPPASYTYTWSNGASAQNLSNLPPGTYTVTVSAGGTCTEVATIDVPQVPNNPELSFVYLNARCGLANGSIDLSVFGGAVPFTYTWSGGQTTQDLNNLTWGLYEVTVTGSNGCTASGFVDLPDDVIPVNIDGFVNDKTSCITNNGSISLLVTPTNATIIWSNGSTSANLNNLAPGDYSVTVSAGGTCTSTAIYTIVDVSQPPVLNAEVTPAVCTFSNGEIDLEADLGIPPYTYNWSHIPGNNDPQDVFNLPPANYAVTVTSSVGCTEVLIVNVPNEILNIDINALVENDLSCTSNNGFIDLDVTPDVNYVYDWAHIPGPNNIQDLNNLGQGTYTVTVTFGSCSANASFVIIDAAVAPNVSISPANAICGQSNGAITISVNGATPPYTYNWSHIPGNSDPQNVSNLAPGTYTVTVTDFFDCSATASAVVGNGVIAVNIAGTPADNTSCAAPNGGVNITVSPTNATYTYSWSTGATTEDLSDVSPGIYTVNASAGLGCTASATFIVGNSTIDPILSANVVAAICSQSNGSIDLTVSSGTSPFSFAWSNAVTTEDLLNVPPGNYSVTVSDANSCTATMTYNVANDASTFSLSAAASPHSDCATVNGAVNLTVTPAGPYTFLWSNGATTEDISNLPAGTYTVEVTEVGTCVASATYFVLDTRTYPTLNQSVVPELCNLSDASIDLSVLGGLAPFTYTWQSGQTSQDLLNIGGGMYEVTVTGANNCSATATINVPETDISFSIAGLTAPNTSCVVPNGSIDLMLTPSVPSQGPGYTFTWSNSAFTEDLSGIPPGSYVVTVSAGGTCTNTAAFTVADGAGAPALSASVTEALCGQSSGSVNLSVSGGFTPYTFIWSNGATTEDLTGVPLGSYAVTVTGANGCQITNSFNVPDGIVTPALSGIPQANTACVNPNGSINLSILPNTLTYVITWSSGATTQNLSNLTAGSYTVTVNGGGSCIETATYVVDNNINAVTSAGTSVNVLCFGLNTGAIDLVLNGGTQPFTYNWSPNLGNIQDPSGLSAGNYAVTVTDAVGCSSTSNFTISQPQSALQISCMALNTVSQPGQTDGSAHLTISGGTAPYSVLISPGGIQNGIQAGTLPFNNLGVGTYNVSVTDANGCTSVCSFNITLTPCETALGTMGNSLLSLCGTGCITADYNALGQVLDPNDVLQFVLHQGSGNTIVGELMRSNQPTFCFNPANMTYGTTYYVSAVAGNNDGTGNVDLSHYCTVIATGTPIVFYQIPVAAAAPPAPITCATLQVSLTGSSTLPNSAFQWSTANGTIVGSSNQASILASSQGSYSLLVTSPNGCTNTTNAQVLDIRNDPEAKITASPDDILDCVIDEIILAGEVKGSGNANTIWIDQNGNTYPGGTVLQINTPGPYWFAIVDTVTFCRDTANIVIGENQVYPPLFINPPATLTCTVGSVTLSGGSSFPGIQFQWATVVGQDTVIVGTGTSVNITQANTYLLIGVDPANGCTNAEQVTVLSDQSYPNASAGPPFNIDCFGQTATINGTVSGGIPPFTYTWTTSGGAIVAGANTLTPIISEPGTYTLVVNSTANGCSDTDVVIVAPNEPRASLTVDHPGCFGERGSILVDTVIGAKPPVLYSISGGLGSQLSNLFNNLAAGDYTVYIEDADGCATAVSTSVIQPPKFEVSIDATATVQLGEDYQFEATVNVPLSDIAQITWTPPTWLTCTDCLDPIAKQPLRSQNYRVLVVTKDGCRDDANFLLRVNRQIDVYIPNVIYPNSSEGNDRITVYAGPYGVKQVKSFQIFSRWGEQVYENYNFPPNDPTLGWDGSFRGQEMNPAVFVYYAIVELIDGQEVLFKGDVTVVR